MNCNLLKLASFCLICILLNCTKSASPIDPVVVPPVVEVKKEIDTWTTRGDQGSLLLKSGIAYNTVANNFEDIAIDSTIKYQTVDGFGYTLTGGSAMLINKMSDVVKTKLLNELFGNGDDAIGVSYLRVSIGASDLDATVFSYDDNVGPDVNLTKFNLSQDTINLIPILKKIIAINPKIKIMGSPWSPPVWMKDNGSSIGGSLKPEYYKVYANYLVKYIQAMQQRGIIIDALTVQNEPLHGGNNPSMVMTAPQQADFVKNHLGPTFKAANITTKIVIWDHNCDNAQYPISILNDPEAKKFVDGSAFHLYNGDISALYTVKQTHGDKNLYFTEQWTGKNGGFEGDLMWHIKNVVLGSMSFWSKTALEWNLVNDKNYEIHTPGGCTECKGALMIDGDNVSKNVGYYIIAQISKFVPAGSVRIKSTINNNFPNVAFITPQGKKYLSH
jgi:glucosylceramidase